MIKTYPIPEGEVRSELYQVTADEKTIGLYDVRVSAMPYNTPWPGRERPLNQTERAAMAVFDSDGPVKVAVRPKKDFASALVRPLSEKIDVVTENGEARFTLPGPGNYVFEADDFHGALHIFINPIEEYRKEDYTYYYGPGVHEVGDKRIKSGQSVLVDGGAVVYGSFTAIGAEDVCVEGHGIIDGSHEVRTSDTLLLPYSYRGIIGKGEEAYDREFGNRSVLNGILRFIDCSRVKVRGVIARDSSSFTVIPARCDGVQIDYFRTIGMYRYNSDGIDLFNSKNVAVTRSFLRNFDDCMVIKGICGWDDWNNENISVKHCVVWCDWGRALELGAETNAPEYKNILFEDCDVIHGCDLCMDIQHHNRAAISNVIFRNIRCEYNRHQLSQQFQSRMWEEYDAERPGTHPFLMGCYVHGDYIFCPRERYQSGTIRDVVFEDITVYTEDDVDMPTSNFLGLDAEHDIRNVAVRRVNRNGVPVKTLDELKIRFAGFESGVSYEA